MKFCSSHQIDLKKALERKGLWKLVAADAEESRRRALVWVHGMATPEDMDPLVISTLEIVSKAKQLGAQEKRWGPAACPLCEVSKLMQNAELGALWIDNVTDFVTIALRVNGHNL